MFEHASQTEPIKPLAEQAFDSQELTTGDVETVNDDSQAYLPDTQEQVVPENPTTQSVPENDSIELNLPPAPLKPRNSTEPDIEEPPVLFDDTNNFGEERSPEEEADLAQKRADWLKSREPKPNLEDTQGAGDQSVIPLDHVEVIQDHLEGRSNAENNTEFLRSIEPPLPTFEENPTQQLEPDRLPDEVRRSTTEISAEEKHYEQVQLFGELREELKGQFDRREYLVIGETVFKIELLVDTSEITAFRIKLHDTHGTSTMDQSPFKVGMLDMSWDEEPIGKISIYNTPDMTDTAITYDVELTDADMRNFLGYIPSLGI